MIQEDTEITQVVNGRATIQSQVHLTSKDELIIPLQPRLSRLYCFQILQESLSKVC